MHRGSHFFWGRGGTSELCENSENVGTMKKKMSKIGPEQDLTGTLSLERGLVSQAKKGLSDKSYKGLNAIQVCI